MIYRFCETIKEHLSNEQHSRSAIYHCTSQVPAKRANSAFLICAYQVLVLNRSPEEAWSPFHHLPRFLPFRDASSESGCFDLSILDCLKALQKSQNLNWFNLETFDLSLYEQQSQAENGGFNWIVPEKFIAFANPISRPHQPGLTPEQYCEVFKPLQVSAVIRLNTPSYDPSKFTRRGVKHYDLYFHDGSVPGQDLIEKFLEISEKEKVLAIHCQAGLGRTATLIGCYCINYFDFTGHEFIAWARMSRPGSVLGPQQHFLCDYFQRSLGGAVLEKPVMTPYERFKAKHGDLGQGARLSCQGVRGENGPTSKFTPVTYRTKFNQLVNIDPLLLKLYGKQS